MPINTANTAPHPFTFQKIRETLLAATSAAAGATLPLFRSALTVDNKYEVGFDPVTAADRGAEDAIRAVIEATFPDHNIIGEERANKQTGSRYAWVIDPVDGTRAFITGVPVWGTLIGFSVDGLMQAGIMTQPFIGETFIAVPGESTYLRNGQQTPLKVSSVKSLANAKAGGTSPDIFKTNTQKAVLAALRAQTLTLRYGLDCYGYALIAAGQIDVIVEPGLNSFDIAALIPLIEQAGGIVTDWHGNRVDGGGDVIAAATPDLHAEALELVRNITG